MNTLQLPEKGRVLAVSGGQTQETLLDESKRFSEWEINSLIDFVIQHYHCDAKKNIVFIYDLAKKVAGKHRGEHPELAKLSTALFLFFNDLSFHLKKEEQILFPNIRQLIEKSSHAESFTYTTFGLIEESVLVLKNEHQTSVNELKFIRGLTNNYLIPADASESYKYLFERLKAFEKDLIQHIHLENDILFPKAIQMELSQKTN